MKYKGFYLNADCEIALGIETTDNTDIDVSTVIPMIFKTLKNNLIAFELEDVLDDYLLVRSSGFDFNQIGLDHLKKAYDKLKSTLCVAHPQINIVIDITFDEWVFNDGQYNSEQVPWEEFINNIEE